MFSVTTTGTNLRPLCTAKVRPTHSGTIVDRRDHVLITLRLFVRTASSTFFRRCVSMNGPFLTERAMILLPYAFLRFTMKRSVRLLFRVLSPLASCPHGEQGCRPPEDRPS